MLQQVNKKQDILKKQTQADFLFFLSQRQPLSCIIREAMKDLRLCE